MNAQPRPTNTNHQSTLQPVDEAVWKIREELIAFFDGIKIASIGSNAYLNGGFRVFSNWQESNPKCSYYHGEQKLFTKHGENIANDLSDTETAVLIGAGSAFSLKEEKLLEHFKNLKKVVLIDISSSGNDFAIQQLEQFKAKHDLDFEIIRIDKDLFELTEDEIKKCQSGITTVITTGGMPMNSPGPATDAKPDAKLREVFQQVARILDHGERAKNAFFMTHKLPPKTPKEKQAVKAEYAYIDKEKPYATVRHWLTNCLSNMLKKAEISEHNPNFEDFDLHTLSDFFRHISTYEDRAENCRNGLEVSDEFTLHIPRQNGQMWSKVFMPNDFFCFFNTIYASVDWLSKVALTSNHGRNYSPEVISHAEGQNSGSIFRLEPPRLAA